MELKAAIRRARHDAKCRRDEAKRYRKEGMNNCAELAERDAEMLEALIKAAERNKNA